MAEKTERDRGIYRNVVSCLLTDSQIDAYKKVVRRRGLALSTDLRRYVVDTIEHAGYYNLDDDPAFDEDEDEPGVTVARMAALA